MGLNIVYNIFPSFHLEFEQTMCFYNQNTDLYKQADVCIETHFFLRLYVEYTNTVQTVDLNYYLNRVFFRQIQTQIQQR